MARYRDDKSDLEFPLQAEQPKRNNTTYTSSPSGVEFPVEQQKETIHQPVHYTSSPSGVECIQITEHMNFCLGNVVKYIWRAGLKGQELEDLRKAAWYLSREIERREKLSVK
jgi:hypothetical protein